MAILRTRKKVLLFIAAMLLVLVGAVITSVVVYADSYYTVRIDYYFKDGTTPAHDSYVAAYPAGADVNTTVTNPRITGFAPMTEIEGGDAADETVLDYPNLSENKTIKVYYIAGMTRYRAIYYKQNIYDDLYTRDNTLPSSLTDRYGFTGSNPTDLEDLQFDGFTNLFHEPDAIAADGSTVFRVYYDRNYYTVNFDLGEGGYGVDTIYAKYQSVYHIGEPKREGYTFRGWARTVSADPSDPDRIDEGDSSVGTYGEDWYYADANGKPMKDSEGNPTVDIEGNPVEGSSAKVTPITFNEDVVGLGNTYYRAMWNPTTTKYSIVYWMENPNSTLTEEIMEEQTTSEELRTLVTSNYTVVAAKDFNDVPSNTEVSYDDMIKKYDFFYEYDKKNDKKSTTSRNIGDPSEFPSSHDANQSALSAAQINELNGQGRFFELNTFLTKKNFKDNLRPDMKGEEVLPTKTIAGDGSTRINVYYDRKDFTLKFFYAREKLVNGEPSGLISLTNSTKGFSKSKYYGSDNDNYLKALAMEDDADNAWANNIADSLPHLQTKYTDPDSPNYIPGLEELYKDYTYAKDSSKGYAKKGETYRYYYYQFSAKYGAPLKNKWLLDPVTSVHRKDKADNEMCVSASWAVENGTNYHDSHTSVNNFTIKGFYEKLGKELMFNSSKKTNYTELHYLVSWTNTGSSGWNYGINRVLNFKYQNYTELLPKEVAECENDPNNGPASVKTSGGYTEVRQFTTKVEGVTTTKWYGLKAENIINTVDSGDQYDRNKGESTMTANVRLNQTSADITGFRIENYYPPADTKITLDKYNTIVDWSEDTPNERHATIKFFYRRLIYTLKFRNGNILDREFDQSENNGVAYGVSLNKKDSEGNYLYKYTPEYHNPDLRDYYEFAGWYYTPYYYRQVDFETETMPADDLTLYAKWVPKKIKVSFYKNYNDYYEDMMDTTNDDTSVENYENGYRIPCIYDEDQGKWVDGDIITDYGSYIPNGNIPADMNDEKAVIRPDLDPPAVGAQFAGWYYLRDNVPVRFEPENIPVTALNADAAHKENATFNLYAEWVTKDVAKYKVNYIEDKHPEKEVADPTTGRAFVYKTKTFDAAHGDELNAEHAWNDDGQNWWPTVNSHSIVIKSNDQGEQYAPNEYTFRYVQKPSVHYTVQYLDASNREPLREEITRASTHASVQEDAPFIDGYVVTEGTKTLVLAASTAETSEAQRNEELETNVITFYYNKNDTEYMYEVEYYKQDAVGDGYTLTQEENLSVPIVQDGDTTVSPAELYNRHIPQLFEQNGFTRKAGATKVTEINGETITYGVADDGLVVIKPGHRSIIKIYFERNEYTYSYDYVDHKAEENYNKALENGEDVSQMWDGVIQSFTDQGPERVEKDVIIHAEQDITHNGTPYTRIDAKDIVINIAPIIPSNPCINHIKIYYKKYTERELQFKLACANENAANVEVDIDPYTGDPLYGGISLPMQTIERYDDIKSVTFYNYNDAKATGEGGVEDYVHQHKYNFLGWFDNPEGEGTALTTNETLTKEDLDFTDRLPERDKTYYAVVEQEMVKANFEFRCVESSLPVDNAAATAMVETADTDANGDKTGGKFVFSSPGGYINNTDVPWHRTGSFSMSIEPKDNRVYKYEFAEWWEEDLTRTVEGKHPLVRRLDWSGSGEGWTPTMLSSQVTRNEDKHIIAVYKRRAVDSMPYTIKYNFKTRSGEYKNLIKTGTLTSEQLNENNKDAAVNNSGAFELTDEFILSKAPYESNHGETLCWTDDPEYIVKTSEKGNSESKEDQIITTITAKQDTKKAIANYKIYPSDDFTPIETVIGANRTTDEKLKAIDARDRTYEGKEFSYWLIQKKASGDVIAKCYDPWFTFCMMDSYYITPVYNGKIESGDAGDELGTSVQLRHLDYSRNRWTDESESPADPKKGSTDLLYTDFEISFNNKDQHIYNSEDYQVGVVFELCARLPDTATFNPDKDYNQVTNYDNLRQAIIKNAKSYSYKSGKNRSIMISNIPTDNLTNMNRVEFGMPFTNAYTTTNDAETGEELGRTYTNSRYLMKATAFLRNKGENGVFDSDDEIIFSKNPVYVCLSDIAALENAVKVNNLLYTD